MTFPALHAAGDPGSVPAPGDTAAAGTGSPCGGRSIRSQDLLGPGEELWIEHNRKHYRLRVTAQGKLILTA